MAVPPVGGEEGMRLKRSFAGSQFPALASPGGATASTSTLTEKSLCTFHRASTSPSPPLRARVVESSTKAPVPVKVQVMRRGVEKDPPGGSVSKLLVPTKVMELAVMESNAKVSAAPMPRPSIE